MTNPFPTIHPYYGLFFLYGAAFLILSFSIGMKNMKGSNLRIADSLWLLAIFGFTHGIYQIVEIYPLLEGDRLVLDELFNVKILSLVLIALSFMFLLQFGLSLSLEKKRKRILWTLGAYAILFIILTLFMDMHANNSKMLILGQMNMGVRNTLGLIGGLTAAYGMITYSYSREIQNLLNSIARNIYIAGVIFALFAFMSTTLFSDIARHLDVPPELFRGGAAILITYFIMKALNIFDIETRLRVETQARALVQSEKLASLGQLSAGIAHEINNPLTNASLGIQLLRSKICVERGQEALERLNAVEKNIDRAALIAQELLTFSRQRETEFHPLNINDIITGALMLMKYNLKKVVIRQDLRRIPDVMGDKGKLEQVFINILSNALDAMPNGGRVAISTMVRDGMVEACIEDTGAGIDNEDLEKVFNPFYTTKEIGLGTGLGLSISYGIIKQHKGDITLSSIVGQGTTVTIKIPIRE